MFTLGRRKKPRKLYCGCTSPAAINRHYISCVPVSASTTDKKNPRNLTTVTLSSSTSFCSTALVKRTAKKANTAKAPFFFLLTFNIKKIKHLAFFPLRLLVFC